MPIFCSSLSWQCYIFGIYSKARLSLESGMIHMEYMEYMLFPSCTVHVRAKLPPEADDKIHRPISQLLRNVYALNI
jgi:hypothetical protein